MNKDELDENAFLDALLDFKYAALVERARKEEWVVCVPSRHVLLGVLVDDTLIKKHVLLPSKFVVGEYQVLGGGQVIIRGGYVQVFAANHPQGSAIIEVRVLGEDRIHDSRLPPLRVIVVDGPLVLSPHLRRTQLPAHEVWFAKVTSSSDYVRALARIAKGRPMMSSERECVVFCSSFVIVPTALDMTASKVKAICSSTVEELCGLVPELRQCDPESRLMRELEVATNCFVMLWVHKKILDGLHRFESQRNQALARVLETHTSPRDLGLRDEIVCEYAGATAEMTKMSQAHTPLDMMLCLRRVAEAAIADLTARTTPTPASPQESIALAADDMIAITMYVLSKAQLTNPFAFLLFMQYFGFPRLMHSKFGYHMSTFEAAVMYLLSLAEPNGDEKATPQPLFFRQSSGNTHNPPPEVQALTRHRSLAHLAPSPAAPVPSRGLSFNAGPTAALVDSSAPSNIAIIKTSTNRTGVASSSTSTGNISKINNKGKTCQNDGYVPVAINIEEQPQRPSNLSFLDSI